MKHTNKEPPVTLRLWLKATPEWVRYDWNYYGAWVDGEHLEHWPTKNKFRYRRRIWTGLSKDITS